MNRHLRAGWKTAKVGLAIGLFSIVSEGFGALVFGDAPEWGLTLVVAALMTVLFGIGGVLYGIILPRLARGRIPASAEASILTGIAAGVATMMLFASPLIAVPLLRAVPIPFGAVAMMLGVGALVGTIGGIYATKTRRTESPGVHPGTGHL